MLHTEFSAALKLLWTSQAEFARWIRRDIMTVNRWANGKVPVPGEIARLLNEIMLRMTHRQDVGGILTTVDAFNFDDYTLLGVSKESSRATVKSAYRRLQKIYHPDMGGDHLAATRIQSAFERIEAGFKAGLA